MTASSKGETRPANAVLAPSTDRPETPVDKGPASLLPYDIQKDALDAFIIDHGIMRSNRAASYFLLQAEAALRQDRGAEAIRLGELAKKSSPFSPLPFFFLAEAYFHVNPFNLSEAMWHTFKGLHLTFTDIFLLASLLSPYFLLLFVGTILSLVTFIVYSLLLYAPIWIHQLSESSKGYLHPIPAGLLFGILFFFPLLLGLPILWFFLFSFLLFWRFYTRSEKGMIIAFLAGVGCTSWVLPVFFTLFTANGTVLFNEMSRNYYADYLWVSPTIDEKPPSWEKLFIQASYETNQGDYTQAARLYKNGLAQQPHSAKILNNLGNISFYLEDYDGAIGHYQEAIKISPKLMSSHYNLSQTYREMLLFDKGKEAFLKAEAISQTAMESLSRKSVRFPNYPVIEERFEMIDLIDRILQEKEKSIDITRSVWQSWLGSIPLKSAPVLALFLTILLISSKHFFDRFFTSKPCSFCKRAICMHCMQRIFSYEACAKCQLRYKTIQNKSEFNIIEDAVKKVPAKLYPLFLLPGGGHLAIGKAKAAFFFLVLFYIFIGSILMQESLIPPSEWYLHRTGSLFQIGLIVMLYVVSLYDLSRMRKIRIWL